MPSLNVCLHRRKAGGQQGEGANAGIFSHDDLPLQQPFPGWHNPYVTAISLDTALIIHRHHDGIADSEIFRRGCKWT